MKVSRLFAWILILAGSGALINSVEFLFATSGMPKSDPYRNDLGAAVSAILGLILLVGGAIVRQRLKNKESKAE